MSTADEKPAPSANVLTITRPTATRSASNQSIEVLSTIEDVDSTHSLSPTHSSRNEKSLERETSPFSPFYNPAPTRYSLEKNKSESKQNINVINSSSYDTDVEACLTPQKTDATCGGKVSLLKSKSRGDMECTVWPGQNALKQKKKAMRRERGKHLMCCGWMAGLNKKTKIWVKVLIALVVVGIAVGVGVGVSRAVGGGVWKNQDAANSPINES
jgi:hypothetical protein